MNPATVIAEVASPLNMAAGGNFTLGGQGQRDLASLGNNPELNFRYDDSHRRTP